MRFSGFTDEWKSFKLKDLLHNKSSSISINQLEDNVGNYPLYGASGFLKCIDFYEMDSDYISIVKDGSGVGNISFHEKNTSVVNTSEYILPKENLNIHFIFYLLQTINLDKYKTGSTIPHIYFKDYSIEKVKIPKYDEQKKIGILLKNLDAKIEILDNKLQMCQNFKKYLMQQIFTQKLRFDFKDTWDKVLLKDVAFIPKKTKLTNIEGLKLLTVKLHTKGIEINDRIKPKLTKRGRPYYIRRSGELLIGRQNFHNGGMGIVPKSLDGGICSNAISSFNVFEDKIDVNYLYYFLARPEYYIKSERLIGGTGQKEFSEKELLKLKIDLPSLEEQNKIVDFLSNIDHKIEISENQLNKTQEFKKGLLQQMFVVQLILSLLQNKKHI